MLSEVEASLNWSADCTDFRSLFRKVIANLPSPGDFVVFLSLRERKKMEYVVFFSLSPAGRDGREAPVRAKEGVWEVRVK
jgi:hypothetical protein